MEVSDIKENQKIIDTYFTLAPLNNILNYFALICISRNGQQIISSWSLTKNITVPSIFILINITSIIFKIECFNFSTLYGPYIFTDSLQWTFLLGFVLYIIDLVYVYNGKDICVEYYNSYKNIDKLIKMKYFKHLRKSVIKLIIFYAVIGLLSSLCDYLVWGFCFNWKMTTLYAVEYLYFIMRMLTVLDTVCQILQIEYRLRMIGDLVQDCYESAKYNYMPSVICKDFVTRKTWSDTTQNDEIFNTNSTLNNCSDEIIWLKRSYLYLTEQTAYINNMYGLRMLLNCLVLLIDMVNALNLAVRIIVKSMVMSTCNYPILTSFMRLITYAAILVSLVHRCERCYRQDDRIIDIIDHLQINKKICAELRGALAEMRTLVCARRTRFHAANFFRLDYSLLVAITSVTVTYTIIFLQSMM